MAKRSTRKSLQNKGSSATPLRIVGGHFRGRKLLYAGDPRVRPMKDRVREALFNLLGPAVRGMFAIDLFGGTGALALEAISRGATGALIVERHFPTAKVIRHNIDSLGLSETVELVTADAFHWHIGKQNLPHSPWVVFVSPPYRFFTERSEEMLELIANFLNLAPQGSLIAVEATKEFDFRDLPFEHEWDVRSYPPAVVAVITVTDSLRDASTNGSPPTT